MPRATTGNLPVPNLPEKSYAPELSDVDYKHSIVNTKYEPMGSLLTHLEGSAWTVDYFSQVLGLNEEVASYDYNQSGTYQQYLYIRRYELKLQGSLNTSVDTTDQTTTVTGTAIMYPYMKPNYGDVFIADMGDGSAGLFSITEVEKKSYFKQACYEIQFILTRYITKDIEDNLLSKVVKITEFVKDFMSYGQNPIIATSDKLRYDNYTNLLEDTLNDWLSEYYSNEYRTIMVPNGTVATYDPFITKMITSVFDSPIYPLVKKIDLLNTDDNNLNYYGDIWTALIHREVYMLRNCFCEYILVSSKALNGNPFLQTAYYSGVKTILIPKPEGNLADERLSLSGITQGGKFNQSDDPSPQFSLPNFSNTHSYVLSKAFYRDLKAGGLSDFENMIRDYLNAKALDTTKLVLAIEMRHDWTLLQRFYVVPALLLLLTSEIRRL